MTTNEFVRRANAFKSLNQACAIFEDESVDFVYRVNTVFSSPSERVEGYFSSLSNVSENILCISQSPDTIIVERFSRQWFLVQFRYFCGFVNRLSKYQLEALRNIPELENLYFMCMCHANKQ